MSFEDFSNFVLKLKTQIGADDMFIILDCCQAGAAGNEIVKNVKSVIFTASKGYDLSLATQSYDHLIPPDFIGNPSFFRFSDSTLFFRQTIRFLDGQNYQSLKNFFDAFVNQVKSSDPNLLESTQGLSSEMLASIFLGTSSNDQKIFPELAEKCSDEPTSDDLVFELVKSLDRAPSDSESVIQGLNDPNIPIMAMEVIASKVLKEKILEDVLKRNCNKSADPQSFSEVISAFHSKFHHPAKGIVGDLILNSLLVEGISKDEILITIEKCSTKCEELNNLLMKLSFVQRPFY